MPGGIPVEFPNPLCIGAVRVLGPANRVAHIFVRTLPPVLTPSSEEKEGRNCRAFYISALVFL